VTTLFHKYTRERDEAARQGDTERIARLDQQIRDMGGRQEYQRASQLSTKFHSTSKWVLGYLARCGWLYGIPQEEVGDGKSKRKRPRRNMRLLEVGAINTELLDAAAETADGKSRAHDQTSEEQMKKYRLEVRAIDLHSSHERIEEADFLTLPIDPLNMYDAVVCSMVINCIPTPEDRGRMLVSLFRQLRPGGLCFLTLPRLCLSQSSYTDPKHFLELLSSGVGFEVKERKESPKVAFYVLKRPLVDETERRETDPKWTKLTAIRKGGKKLRNHFAVVLKNDNKFIKD
jgi:25S rRNA (adenine2142-N1)-methyltransferase